MFVALSSLCVCLVIGLVIKILHELWWVPHRIQRLMRSQGIGGPSYRFIHGSTKEILALQKEAMSKPLSLSDHNIFPRLHPSFHYWTKLYGKNYLQWIGTEAQLIVTEAELIKEIMTDKEKVYLKVKTREDLKKIFGDGVSRSHGVKWAKMRKLANHAFQTENLKNMIPAMISSVESMIERWKQHDEGKEIEIYKEFGLLTSEVISRTAFGSSYLEGKTIFETLDKLVLISARNSSRWRVHGKSKIFKSDDEIESEKLEKGMHESITNIIKRREEKVQSGELDSFQSDFLGVLLKAHHDADEQQRVSMDEIIDECKTIYFAGKDTTNSLLAWTILLLTIHPDWQEEARNEVLTVFGKQNPTADSLTKLKSINMIINETLRLYPPAPSMARRVERGVRLGNLNIPANMTIHIPSLASHSDHKIWGENAHLFKPERFSEGIAKATQNNLASYFPFGMGPRICVGFNFAILESKIALSMILQCYSFMLSPAYLHSPIQKFTTRPQFGVQVMLRKL